MLAEHVAFLQSMVRQELPARDPQVHLHVLRRAHRIRDRHSGLQRRFRLVRFHLSQAAAILLRTKVSGSIDECVLFFAQILAGGSATL